MDNTPGGGGGGIAEPEHDHTWLILDKHFTFEENKLNGILILYCQECLKIHFLKLDNVTSE